VRGEGKEFGVREDGQDATPLCSSAAAAMSSDRSQQPWVSV